MSNQIAFMSTNHSPNHELNNVIYSILAKWKSASNTINIPDRIVSRLSRAFVRVIVLFRPMDDAPVAIQEFTLPAK